MPKPAKAWLRALETPGAEEALVAALMVAVPWAKEEAAKESRVRVWANMGGIFTDVCVQCVVTSEVGTAGDVVAIKG